MFESFQNTRMVLAAAAMKARANVFRRPKCGVIQLNAKMPKAAPMFRSIDVQPDQIEIRPATYPASPTRSAPCQPPPAWNTGRNT